MKELFLSTRKS